MLNNKRILENKDDGLGEVEELNLNKDITSTTTRLSLFVSNNEGYYYNETYLPDQIKDYEIFIEMFDKKVKIIEKLTRHIDSLKLGSSRVEFIIEIDNLWIINTYQRMKEFDTLEKGNILNIQKKEIYYKLIIIGNGKEQVYFNKCSLEKDSDDVVVGEIWDYILDKVETVYEISCREAKNDGKQQVV